MAEVPDLPSIIEAAITRRLRGVHTCALGECVAYSEADQTMTVRLTVQLDGEDVPPLEDVPVTLPGAWSAGDPCLVVFSEEPFAADFAGLESAPEARHGLNAIAVPVWATAGQAVQFVGLANLIDARLETIRTTWTVPTAMGPSGPPSAGGAPVALATVAATKVKAR